MSPRAGCRYVSKSGSGIRVKGDIIDGHIEAVLSETEGHGSAYAAPAAGDKSDWTRIHHTGSVPRRSD
jgi:hypothetical protein